MTRYVKPCSKEGCSFVAMNQGICQQHEIDRNHDRLVDLFGRTFNENEERALRAMIRFRVRLGLPVYLKDAQIILDLESQA